MESHWCTLVRQIPADTQDRAPSPAGKWGVGGEAQVHPGLEQMFKAGCQRKADGNHAPPVGMAEAGSWLTPRVGTGHHGACPLTLSPAPVARPQDSPAGPRGGGRTTLLRLGSRRGTWGRKCRGKKTENQTAPRSVNKAHGWKGKTKIQKQYTFCKNPYNKGRGRALQWQGVDLSVTKCMKIKERKMNR